MKHVTGSSHRIPFMEIKVEEFTNPLPTSTVLSVDQVQHLFSVPVSNTSEGLRNLAILALTIICGLNVDEINQLEISDLDLQNRTMIINGNHGAYRRVSIPDEAYVHLNKWLSIRAQFNTRIPTLFVPSDQIE